MKINYNFESQYYRDFKKYYWITYWIITQLKYS